MPHRLTVQEYKDNYNQDKGFCRNCGEVHTSVEQEAEALECTNCSQFEVYGLKMYLLYSWID